MPSSPGWIFASPASGTQGPLPAPFADNFPAATKSKTSEDIAQSSKYSPAYSPDPYYHSESEYWSFQGSPKGNGPELGWGKGKPIPAPKPSHSLGGTSLDLKVGLGRDTCQSDPKILAAFGT